MDKGDDTMINEYGRIAPKRKAHVQQRDLADGCVLHDEEKGMIYSLNVTASFVWSLCDGRHSLAAISELLADASGRTADSVSDDVLYAVETLRNQGLLLFDEP